MTTLLKGRGEKLDDVRKLIEKEVRFANISIIEGLGASQYGISIVSARIAEMILRDERAPIPVGSYQQAFGVTLSLPTVVGQVGAVAVLQPDLAPEERTKLEKSAELLRAALQTISK